MALALGVAALSSVSSERMLRDMDADLRARLVTYSTALSTQLTTAVAHDDRNAARQVLRAVTGDADVIAVVLRTDRGTELYRYGEPAARRSGDFVDAAVVESEDRIAIAVPVPTTESRGGQLLLELSTIDLRLHHRTAVWTAIAAGTAALLFAVLARRLIGRSVVQRLRAILEVETAEPDADSPAAAEPPHDEISVLGDAFHDVLDRLRHDQVRLRQTVSDVMAVEDELARTNHELEQRVRQRTAELSAANHQLQVEMTQRSQIEVELRQAQKLESVGRLASGIAHEINTPVQFVSDSCSFLETATGDLIAVIAAYRSSLAELDARTITAASAAAQMAAVEAERDVAYLVEQIPLAIDRALGGLQRVSAIVGAMKEFAYRDHQEQAPADLNRAILSTLTVARNEYKYVAEVRTELAELPLVTCHIGELNQAILNMVVNSAHAIAAASAERERKGLIVIRTRVRRAERGDDDHDDDGDGDEIEVEIEDNGCGIPASAIDKVFDPFFTTKEIGVGTGQGLAIARAVVVDKHAGKIEVASRIGEGTTFSITLPVLGRRTAKLPAAAGVEPLPSAPDDANDVGHDRDSGRALESA